MAFTPNIETKGLFTLLIPFNNAMAANIAYTVVGIRTISDIIAGGEDPFALAYQSANISQDSYNADLAANVLIVSFRSDGGQFLYIPNTYISAAPNLGGVPYTSIALGISLGPIPDSLDLSVLTQKIIDDVQAIIGITSTVTPMAISPTTILSNANAATIEAARQANITTNTTDYALYLAEHTAKLAAQEEVQILSNWIKNNH